MKKFVIILCLSMLLTGCAARSRETVSDDLVEDVMAQARTIELDLPYHAAAPVINTTDGGKLYLCDGYVLTVQTMAAGDLNRTANSLSGFGRDGLTMLETKTGSNKCYEWVWSAAGEGGDQLGRAMVLDDGAHHYCLTAMTDAETAGALEVEWDQIFGSFSLG